MLTARELATLLAALRHWQQTYSETDIPSLITAWPQFAADAPLSSAEIDTLCARLNQLCGCESPGPFCCGIPGILAMLADFRVRLIEMGAAGRLLINGEIENVLPMEDAEALEKANPITPDSKVRLEQAKTTERHDAIVKNALKSSLVCLMILGGEHDLTESINRLGGGK